VKEWNKLLTLKIFLLYSNFGWGKYYYYYYVNLTISEFFIYIELMLLIINKD